jgi:hypothetical protein
MKFRAQEGSGAILFSPGKVRAALELQEHRLQEKEQGKADKQARAEERALAKIQKQKEAQQRRDDRAAAKAARDEAEVLRKAKTAADKEARKARRQAKLESKVVNSRLRARSNKRQVLPQPGVAKDASRPQNVPNQSATRSGRIVRLPARLME